MTKIKKFLLTVALAISMLASAGVATATTVANNSFGTTITASAEETKSFNATDITTGTIINAGDTILRGNLNSVGISIGNCYFKIVKTDGGSVTDNVADSWEMKSSIPPKTNGTVLPYWYTDCTSFVVINVESNASVTWKEIYLRPVVEVSLNKESTTLEVGKGENLQATTDPANNDTYNRNGNLFGVTWSSSDAGVATVDADGKVTAVAPGTAIITVKTGLKIGGNLSELGSKTATCTVSVVAEIVSVTGVTLNKDTASLTVGGKKTLVATVAPENATNKNVTWESSDTNVATVDANGKVTAVGAGTATITAKTADGDFTATCVVTVSVAKKPLSAGAIVAIIFLILILLIVAYVVCYFLLYRKGLLADKKIEKIFSDKKIEKIFSIFSKK